jgi:hypothetical protein
MSNHQCLTEEYLAGYAASANAKQIRETVRESVEATSYRDRSLTRPVFLGYHEHQRLSADLNNIQNAIAAIPNRLFHGDLTLFADAVGMNAIQTDAVLRSHRDTPIRLSRADLCLTPAGFRLIELNVGSTLAGFDNCFLNESMLEQPYIAEFVRRHRLGYIDSLAELAHTILVECKVPTGTRPVMAIADWPESFLTLEPQLHKSAALLARHGLEPLVCHVGQLRFADGAVWLGERKIDIVYRMWTLPDLMEPAGPGLIYPVLSAVQRGEVQIFAPMETYLYGSKGALAILADESYRPRLTGAERVSVDRLIPWTRMVRPGPVTVAGRRVDLLAYAIARRTDLVLKPSLLFGGIGVVAGWLTDPDEWLQQVEAAMGGPYVLQQRVNPNVELFPGEHGLEPWTLIWAQFNMVRGAAGIWVRAIPGSHPNIVNMTRGATATCCFVETSPDFG